MLRHLVSRDSLVLVLGFLSGVGLSCPLTAKADRGRRESLRGRASAQAAPSAWWVLQRAQAMVRAS